MRCIRYAALSGLDAEFLLRIFEFRPVVIGSSMRIRGAEFSFFYGLHSIPCIGFKASFAGESIAFSGDHLNDPARVRELHERGVLSAARRDELLHFPWDAGLILHEAGVPPIHTPISFLASLPPDVKRRLLVVHCAAKDVPPESGLRRATAGVKNTIVRVQPKRHRLASQRARARPPPPLTSLACATVTTCCLHRTGG